MHTIHPLETVIRLIGRARLRWRLFSEMTYVVRPTQLEPALGTHWNRL